MSENSLTNDAKVYNCPACGEGSIPEHSIVEQVLIREICMQGTCSACGTTRTLWVAYRTVLDNSMWQAQWYDVDSLNDDCYERGGFYRNTKDALEGARRGKLTQDRFKSLFDKS